VWVTNGISQVFKIDPANNKVIKTIPVAGGAFDVIGGFGSVWLSKSGNNTLVRIDPGSAREADSVTVGISPRFIAVGPEGLWVASGDNQQVFLVHP
jgi:YVTN family beta-propeller protein